MSPEQASGERVVDGRTDMYALAVMLYEMLAGEPPYTGPTAQAISARKVASPPPSVRVVRPVVSAALDESLRRALAPNPADRFHDAREFAESLELALRDSLTTGTNQSAGRLRRIARRAWRVAASWRTVALAGVASTAVLLLWPRGATTGSSHMIRLSLPTGVLAVTDHGPASVVALSPDGRLLAYVAGDGGSGQLFLRRLDAATLTPVKDATHAQAPFFSPDGNWLGFIEESRGMEQAVLRKLRLADGEQFTICPAPGAHGATWLPDGRIVIGSMENNGGGLSIVSADGGRPEVIASPDGAKQEVFLVFPSALPDGRAVLFTAEGGRGQAVSLNVLELASKRRTQLLAGGGWAVALAEGVLVYAAEGSLFAGAFDLAGRRLSGKPQRVLPGVLMNLPFEPGLGHFAIGGDGTLAYLAGDAQSFHGGRLWWADSADRTTTIVEELRRPPAQGGGQLSATGPRWSPRGNRVVFWTSAASTDTTSVGLTGEVWVVDTRTGAATKVFPESRYFWPIWSADGEWVIAPRAEDSLNATALFRRRADGRGEPERITATIPQRFMQPFDVSRDGSLLFYQVTSNVGDGASDIFVLSLTGDRTPRALLATPAMEYGPAISPDGKWLAYALAEKGRLPQVFVSDFPALARRWQVSFEGGESPVWSPDGRALFFALVGGGQGVDRVRFNAAQDPPVGRAERFARPPAIGLNYASLYGRPFDVSPDGRRVLSGGGGVGGGLVDTTKVRELAVIVNWRSAMRRALHR
jgi:serine/threonine-protein kinase